MAIAGLTLTGSALLLFVGVLAGGIYLLYQFGNFAKTMESNLKALEESWNGNKGMARFYGGVDGISSWMAKNDFGDRYDNRRAEFWGETYDIVGTAAKRLRDMTNLTNNLYSLSNVYGTGENGKKVIVDHDFSVKNIKKNIAEKMNAARLDAGMLYDEKNKKWRWDAFDGKKLLFGSDSSSEGIVKNTKTVMNGWKKVEQWIDGKNENIENIKDFYDSVLSNPEISTGEYHDKLSAAVSGILDIVGKGGFGEYTGTVLNPLADWYEVIAGCIKDLEETDFAW